MAEEMVPISSKKSVPLSAAINSPFLSLTAPVKAPLTWPKSSLCKRCSGKTPQSTAIKGLSLRLLRSWRSRAINSLPVPLSPWIRTVAWLSATLATSFNTSRTALLFPIIFLTPSLSFSFSRSRLTSLRSSQYFKALPVTRRISSLRKGLVR